ncbi:hypothetical protein [Bradyrhizobium sp. RT11b]|uniref:hypothetical protein n=1 Tax=Bradyrhizobium sp. RT11b TaxID=3156332 RepID=UPI00339AAE8C
MPSFDGDFVHFVSDRVISIPGQTTNASPDHEMRSSFSSRVEQLIDIALAITDMGASSRIAQQLRGYRTLSSHRMLSFFKMGTHVGLIFLSAAVP